ncbi:hypothetical protein FOL47_011053 [Perkinsus chesapeaki]|uniref:Tc1-like transposase DDE domain-containing protein n=1 Tax=Perkinsus chesapeaki TaxID=330153 RepID=A0A7J6L1E0_PERCH|nr:hypothetical protein FOL47_011053 [Perkinsus chesapeaki]
MSRSKQLSDSERAEIVRRSEDARSSKEIFEGTGVTMKPKTSRNRVLNQLGRVKQAIAKPALTARHKKTRYEWAENNIKREFSSVLFTDELDPPWLRSTSSEEKAAGGGGVMFWAGIIGDTVVGPCRVEKGVKMDSKAYTELLANSFLPWYRSRPAAFKRKLIFMHDNAPAHSSKFTTSFLEKNGFKGKKVLELSPDLNPIENYWSLLKREVYRQGTQYDSVASLWSAIEDAAKKITPEEVKKLACSMDKRLTKLLQLHGGHVGA